MISQNPRLYTYMNALLKRSVKTQSMADVDLNMLQYYQTTLEIKPQYHCIFHYSQDYIYT